MTEEENKEVSDEKGLSIISDLKTLEKKEKERFERAVEAERKRVEEIKNSSGKSMEELREKITLEEKRAINNEKEKAMIDSKAIEREYAQKQEAAKKLFSKKKKGVKEIILKELLS